MRLVSVVIAIAVAAGSAHADGKALKPYVGKIVISPDPPPTDIADLPGFLEINATKDGNYHLIKGPPWPFHLVAVLAKDPGARKITLVFADKADKTLAPVDTIEVTSRHRIVLAQTEATAAAGFTVGKTYVVRIMLGKSVLARTELELRD